MTSPSSASDRLPSLPYRSALVSGRKPLRFNFRPDADERAAVAAALNLIELPEFTFKGELAPLGRGDVTLRAELNAVVVQPCSVTLAPVRAALSDSAEVRYMQDYQVPDAEDLEIPAEDIEPLPDVIDAGFVATEALALALPPYPRAEGVELGETVHAAPGVQPLRDEDLRPFSGLASLAEKLGLPHKDGE